MKSPFLWANQRSWSGIRKECLWIVGVSLTLWLLSTKTAYTGLWHTLLTLSSPWALVCTWASLRLSLPSSLALACALSIALDQLAGMAFVPILAGHLLATALTRLVCLPINFSLALSVPIHVFFWSLFYDLGWVGLTLLGHGATQGLTQELTLLYQYPLLSLKDALVAISTLYIPLQTLQKKHEE